MDKHPFQTTTIAVVSRRLIDRMLARPVRFLAALLTLGAVLAIWQLVVWQKETARGSAFATLADPTGRAPFCTGFDAEKESGARRMCANGAALMAVDDAPLGPRPGEAYTTTVNGPCCALPYPDVLTGRHVHNVSGECPDGYVVTSRTWGRCAGGCGFRCSEIDSMKYTLGPPTRGLYWYKKLGLAAAGIGTASAVTWSDLPPAFQAFIGRANEWETDVDGCVGAPFGSLLTGAHGDTCDSFVFRQLLFRDGRSVLMYPACARLEMRPGSEPRCVPPADAPRSGAAS